MRFHLSDDQIALKDAIGRFLKEGCEAGARRRAVEGDAGAGRALWQGCAEIGVTGLAVPEAQGGLGLELIDLALAAEVFGYEAAPSPFLGHALAVLAIVQGGTPAQQAEWLPRLASGAVTGTLAIAGGGERWAPDTWRTTVTGGKASGTKRFVPWGAGPMLAVVGLAGGGLGLVDATDLRTERVDVLDRTRPLVSLSLSGTAIDPLPHADATRLFDALLTLLAADAHGAGRRAIDMTVAYVGERRQFGRAIGSYQGVKHQLANVTAGLVPTEGMVWYAALADGFDTGTRRAAAALAKAHVADRAVAAARTCVELHGGIGYTWDYDLHIWLKRAMADLSYAGIPAVHRARAVAYRLAAAEGGASMAALL